MTKKAVDAQDEDGSDELVDDASDKDEDDDDDSPDTDEDEDYDGEENSVD